TRVERMEIFGDDGAAHLGFSAYDAGLRELAFMVENRPLQHALWQKTQPGATRVYCPASCASLHVGQNEALLALVDGGAVAGRLIVGADGADSWARGEAGIAVF